MNRLTRRALFTGSVATLLTPSVAGCAPQDARKTYTFETIGLDQPEIPNSGRGQNFWLGQPADPPSWPLTDVYRRPDGAWKAIEKRQGVYDWKILDEALAEAEQRGGRLTWRIMPWYSPGIRPEAPDWIPTRRVIPTDGSEAFTCPDWDSTGYINAWISLIQAMAKHSDKDPRLWAVDISGFGACGEHHWLEQWGHGMTTNNFRQIAEATREAFPNTWILGPALEPGFSLMPKVFGTGGRWGTRYDFLGGQELSYHVVPDYAELWHTGPVVTEWGSSAHVSISRGMQNVRDLHVSVLSSGNKPTPYAQLKPSDRALYEQVNKVSGFRLSLDSVTMPSGWAAGEVLSIETTWTNHGVAPTYDEWNLQLLMGQDVVLLPGDLRDVLPGTTTMRHQITAPTAPVRDMAIRVVDPHKYLAPLGLATVGRRPDGGYPLT